MVEKLFTQELRGPDPMSTQPYICPAVVGKACLHPIITNRSQVRNGKIYNYVAIEHQLYVISLFDHLKHGFGTRTFVRI